MYKYSWSILSPELTIRLKQKFSRRDPPKSRAKAWIYSQVFPQWNESLKLQRRRQKMRERASLIWGRELLLQRIQDWDGGTSKASLPSAKTLPSAWSQPAKQGY